MSGLKWAGVQVKTIFDILLVLGNSLVINKHRSQIYISQLLYRPSFREKKKKGKPKPLNKNNSLLEPETFIVTNRISKRKLGTAFYSGAALRCNKIDEPI